MVLHPLEEIVGGVRTLFYEEVEEVLSHLPRLGVGLIMRKPERAALGQHEHGPPGAQAA